MKRDCGSALTRYNIKVQRKGLEVRQLNGVWNGFHTKQPTAEKHAKYAVALKTPIFNPKLTHEKSNHNIVETVQTKYHAVNPKIEKLNAQPTRGGPNGFVIKCADLPQAPPCHVASDKKQRSSSAQTVTDVTCILPRSVFASNCNDVISVPRVGISASNGECAILPNNVEQQSYRSGAKGDAVRPLVNGDANLQSRVERVPNSQPQGKYYINVFIMCMLI